MCRRKNAGSADSSRGFTLLELTVALGILTIGVLMGVLPLQITAVGMRNYTSQRFNAVIIAKQFLDNYLLTYTNSGLGWTATKGGKVNTNDYQSDKTKCPAGFSETCASRQEKNLINSSGDPVAANRVVCRQGTAYYLSWKAEAPAMDSITTTNSTMVTVQVSWRPPPVLGGYKQQAAGACYIYEEKALKFCDLGDGSWGCQ